MSEQKIILFCTVGGSYRPIVQAIEDTNADYICFLCSGKNVVTGQPGSDRQIVGRGAVIKEKFSDSKETLPNIPTQLNLAEENYEVVLLPTDDLDEACVLIDGAVQRIAERFSDARLLANYTCGTKTMAVALGVVALESERMELQLVTGSRSDLHLVQDGTQRTCPVNIERLRITRQTTSFAAAWQRYAYDEAAMGLRTIPTPVDSELRSELWCLVHLSEAFAAWDRFDHAGALAKLDMYRPRLAPVLTNYYQTLARLTRRESPEREAERILDLWRNAERRAVQGRYDDAVARAYRIVEWGAQWILAVRCELDTAAIPVERIPEGMRLQPTGDGETVPAGLMDAWQLVARLTEGPGALLFQNSAGKLRQLLVHRNLSILAHGYTPISRDNWQEWSTWMEGTFIPMLIDELRVVNKRIALPPQLPVNLDWLE